MGFSFKWVVPVLGVVVGTTLAFAGCTVTSGTVDKSPTDTPPTTPPETPPGTPPPTPPGATCDGYTLSADNTTDIGTDCKSCLDTSCCTEMKTCFNLPAGTATGGGAGQDCNGYTHCIFQCNGQFGADPDAGADLQSCYTDCDTLTSQAVIDAYGDTNPSKGYIGCAATNCASRCQTL
jgi:hypothetical protein